MMELWNHCENPYPFVPAEVLDARVRRGGGFHVVRERAVADDL